MINPFETDLTPATDVIYYPCRDRIDSLGRICSFAYQPYPLTAYQ